MPQHSVIHGACQLQVDEYVLLLNAEGHMHWRFAILRFAGHAHVYIALNNLGNVAMFGF